MYCKFITNFQDLNRWPGTETSRLANMSHTMENTAREVEQKNRSKPRRATSKTNVGAREAYENEEAMCGKCSKYVAKTAKYKAEMRVVKEENEKLKSQLSDRRETDALRQLIVSNVLSCFLLKTCSRFKFNLS